MTDFHEICLRETSETIEEKASELGWSSTNCEYETVFLKADEWGELKRKIDKNREGADVIVFQGGNEELNRKACETSRVDVLLHPEKDRKDSGINHVMAEKAAENRVAIGFDMRQLRENTEKYRSFVLKHWRRNLKLCEKYDTPFILTTGASQEMKLRAPRDTKSIIDSLGFEGRKAVSKYPKVILERAEKVKSDGSVRPGIEEVEE